MTEEQRRDRLALLRARHAERRFHVDRDEVVRNSHAGYHRIDEWMRIVPSSGRFREAPQELQERYLNGD